MKYYISYVSEKITGESNPLRIYASEVISIHPLLWIDQEREKRKDWRKWVLFWEKIPRRVYRKIKWKII